MEIAIAKIRKGDIDIDFSLFSILSRDKRNRSILHLAVELGRLDLVKILVSRFDQGTISHLLFNYKGGRTVLQNPIQLAARVGNIKMLQYLIDLCVSWSRFSTCCEEILKLELNQEIREMLVRAARKSEFSTCLISFAESRKELEENLNRFFWWENRFDYEWSSWEIMEWMKTVVRYASRGLTDCIDYILESTKISVERVWYDARKTYLSVPDHVIVMSNRYFFPIGDERFQLLDSSEENKEKARRFQDYYYGYSSFFHHWNGKPESLIEESKSSNEEYEKEQYQDNLYMMVINESEDPEKVSVMEYFANLYLGSEPAQEKQLNISDFFPRLDLVVSHWQIGIFRWMISKKFINLSEQTIFLDYQNEKNAHEEKSIELDSSRDECAICYNAKEFAQTFDCKHSFCIHCSRKTFYEEGEFQISRCPLCRTHLKPPILFCIVTRLLYDSKDSAPWMKSYFSDNEPFSLAKYLLALSAGSDSLLIFYEIVKNNEIDLLRVNFRDMSNIMHVVCENGSMFVFKWLVENGFSSLVHQKRNDGTFPWQLSISCKLLTSFNIFAKVAHDLLPDSWIELAILSENTNISYMGGREKYDILFAKLQNLDCFRDASAEEIKYIFHPFTMESNQNLVKYFSETIVPSERLDAFFMFIDTVEENNRVEETLKALLKVIPKDHIHYQVYVDTINFALANQKTSLELSANYFKVWNIGRYTDPSIEMDYFLEKQTEIISRIDKKYLDKSKYKIVLDGTFLSEACKDTSPMLVSKLLERNELKNDFESIGEILVECENFDNASLLFSHLRKYDALKHNHVKKMFEFCLRWLNALNFRFLIDPKNVNTKYLKYFTFLRDCVIEHKEIITAEELNEIPAVFCFFNSIEAISTTNLTDELSQFLSLQILTTLKCFQNAGFDPTSISHCGLEFIQHLVRKSTPLCLSSIEYLAIERNISIQKIDLTFTSHSWGIQDIERLSQIKRMQNGYQSGSFKKQRI